MGNYPTDLRQVKQGLDALNKLQEKINNLKVSLSHVLSKEFSAELLVRMELFQTHLLNHDAAIAVLKHELSMQTTSRKTASIFLVQSTQSDPTNDIKLMNEEIEKLNNQLGKYTTAFAPSAI